MLRPRKLTVCLTLSGPAHPAVLKPPRRPGCDCGWLRPQRRQRSALPLQYREYDSRAANTEADQTGARHRLEYDLAKDGPRTKHYLNGDEGKVGCESPVLEWRTWAHEVLYLVITRKT